MLPEETLDTPNGLNPITSLTDNAEFEIREPSLSVNNKIVKTSLMATMGVADNNTYRTRTKTKVLWTGPLSVVSTPTSLDVGEKFSDWDMLIIYASLTSDTSPGARVMATLFPNITQARDDCRFYNTVAHMTYQRLSDTTFQLLDKTVSVGNLSSIIGISL